PASCRLSREPALSLPKGRLALGAAALPSAVKRQESHAHSTSDGSNPVLETQFRIGKLVPMARNFKDLTEREILALAISLEEEDGRVYADFADGLRETYPATAKLFDDMGAEESEHRASLIATYRQRFGEHIPLLRRQDVKGFVQ